MEVIMESSAVFKIFRVNSVVNPEPQLPDDEEGEVSCRTCAFWVRDEEEESIGECRCNPPQVITLPDEGGIPVPVSIFPAVEFDQWCGEYQED